jgi:hypothetical protein
MNKYMFNLSMAYTEEKLYRKAYETFQITLFRAPSDIDTYIGINKLFLSAQEDEQGREDLKLGEDVYEIPVRLARIAFNYRQYNYAAQYLSDAVKMEAGPEMSKSIEEKLTNAVKQNKLKAYESNIANNATYSTNRSFRFYLKFFDYILRKYKPLKGAFAGWLLDQAEQIDSQNPFLPVYRARWYVANNDLDKATAVLESFLADNENFLPALEQLGVC